MVLCSRQRRSLSRRRPATFRPRPRVARGTRRQALAGRLDSRPENAATDPAVRLR